MRKGGHLQIYAPVTNENIYTNLWHGPFYGFERVIETFEMTDAPAHQGRGHLLPLLFGQQAGQHQGLAQGLPMGAEQQAAPGLRLGIHTQGEDFYEFAIGRDARAGACAARASCARCACRPAGPCPWPPARGVAGYAPGVDGSYLHLAGGVARMVVRTGPPTASTPYLVDANARLKDWQTQADGSLRFTLEGHVPLELRMYLPPGCSLSCRQFLHQRGSRYGPLLHPFLQKCQPQCPTPSAMPCALSARPRFLTG
jgi:hypothetical protein